MRAWIRQWMREWLGVEALAQELATRSLDLRAEFHRETTAIASEMMAMQPTLTAFAQHRIDPGVAIESDPHLGRW